MTSKQQTSNNKIQTSNSSKNQKSHEKCCGKWWFWPKKRKELIRSLTKKKNLAKNWPKVGQIWTVGVTKDFLWPTIKSKT